MRKIGVLIFRIFLGIGGAGLILTAAHPLYGETLKLHVFNEGEGVIQSIRILDFRLGVTGRIHNKVFFRLVTFDGSDLQVGNLYVHNNPLPSEGESIQPSQFDGLGNVTQSLLLACEELGLRQARVYCMKPK